jgi:hypothetical protein
MGAVEKCGRHPSFVALLQTKDGTRGGILESTIGVSLQKLGLRQSSSSVPSGETD